MSRTTLAAGVPHHWQLSSDSDFDSDSDSDDDCDGDALSVPSSSDGDSQAEEEEDDEETEVEVVWAKAARVGDWPDIRRGITGTQPVCQRPKVSPRKPISTPPAPIALYPGKQYSKQYNTIPVHLSLSFTEALGVEQHGHQPPPPPNWQSNPNKWAEQMGGPNSPQNSPPVTWISVPGPKPLAWRTITSDEEVD